MHLATLHLTPILAAEKSKVPFYIAGGALVAWALIVSLGLGLRRPDFPGSQSGERLLIAISAVLVAITASTAVITSGSPAKAAGGSSTQSVAGGESTQAPATHAPTSSTATTAPAKSPKATTGTPAPPSSPAAGNASSSLKLVASPAGQLSYDTKQLSAKAGTVTITMANMSQLEHNLTIASGSTVLGATPTFVGGTRTLTLKLKPGTYTFYCSVPGHRQAGMEGTLTVS
jgi:plastocyanin